MLHDTLKKILGCRRACQLRMASKRKTHDNFQGSIGIIEAFRASYPVDNEWVTRAFFEKNLDQHARIVAPGNAQGDALYERLKSLDPR